MGKTSKKIDESFVQYRERVLNPISPSFCGAKWFNSTVWLGCGMTASCHHPPAHRIPIAEVLRNYKAIHNTKNKKEIRKQMLEGIRPKECDYCWKIEDLGYDKISDRVHKSLIYSEEELLSARDRFNWREDVDLKTLEIAFDSICNLACSYCSPSISTKWRSDIDKNGPYVDLHSGGGAQAYQQNGSASMPFGKDNENNPYVDAFWKWWESDLKFSLRELRITGGEPLMSPHFWKLLEWWNKNDECEVELAINSNLCVKDDLIKSLIDSTRLIKGFHLYTSCEAVGKKAEYIRDGLRWDIWLANLKFFLKEAKFKSVNCMLTINALSLYTLTEFLEEIIVLKKEHNRALVCSINILRFPSFMAVSTLPLSNRRERADHIEGWVNQNREFFWDWELDGLHRLIAYLRNIEDEKCNSTLLESMKRDWKSFYSQYDQRRNKNFLETFPMLKDFWETI